VNFDTFAQKGHICPEDKNIFLKSAMERKKAPTSVKCPKLPKQAKMVGGGPGHSNQGKCGKGK
jgi:hypothetical protein